MSKAPRLRSFGGIPRISEDVNHYDVRLPVTSVTPAATDEPGVKVPLRHPAPKMSSPTASPVAVRETVALNGKTTTAWVVEGNSLIIDFTVPQFQPSSSGGRNIISSDPVDVPANGLQFRWIIQVALLNVTNGVQHVSARILRRDANPEYLNVQTTFSICTHNSRFIKYRTSGPRVFPPLVSSDCPAPMHVHDFAHVGVGVGMGVGVGVGVVPPLIFRAVLELIPPPSIPPRNELSRSPVKCEKSVVNEKPLGALMRRRRSKDGSTIPDDVGCNSVEPSAKRISNLRAWQEDRTGAEDAGYDSAGPESSSSSRDSSRSEDVQATIISPIHLASSSTSDIVIPSSTAEVATRFPTFEPESNSSSPTDSGTHSFLQLSSSSSAADIVVRDISSPAVVQVVPPTDETTSTARTTNIVVRDISSPAAVQFVPPADETTSTARTTNIVVRDISSPAAVQFVPPANETTSTARNNIPFQSEVRLGSTTPGAETLPIQSPNQQIILSIPSIPESPTAELVAAMNNLYKNPQGADIHLISNDHAVFHVHRCILMARSTVFAGLLSDPACTQRLVVHGFNCRTVDGLLEFLYSGQTGHLPQQAETLLAAAYRFRIGSLMRASETSLLAVGVTVENVIDWLILADRVDAKNLRRAAVDFFRRNLARMNGLAIARISDYRPELLTELLAVR
ncbi:hypothetical protein BV898_05865 [Hypsibius exemplaris]|uniref:BTB domain-containing protein n=1 Tax=Hypsibius exemplaris TaxID=2072580 RepID=A0A1W0WXY6_HYPEX|nr:hypothetical protein BV898_05865 [Hypsibius exemplaris]